MKPKCNSTLEVPQISSKIDRQKEKREGNKEVKLQKSKFIMKPLNTKDLKHSQEPLEKQPHPDTCEAFSP